MLETDILHTAVENLEKLTKVKVKVDAPERTTQFLWDTNVLIQAGSVNGLFEAIIKNTINTANLLLVLDGLHDKNRLLVAKHFSGQTKELLENRGISYLDIAGNCLIQHKNGIFLQIKGQAMPEEFKERKHKAFNANGIKLIYALLLQPDLVNAPYRTIAETANIASSTVGDILDDLKASKFLYQKNEQERVLANLPELLAQWVTAYHQKLKPKLFRGKFRLPFAANQIKYFQLSDDDHWGGEPAADLLTNYLYPAQWTLYSQKDRKTLIADYKLVPDPKSGNFEVYSPFWKVGVKPFTIRELQVVSPLLVYADLIASGNDRNIETAKRIYEQYLKDTIERGNG